MSIRPLQKPLVQQMQERVMRKHKLLQFPLIFINHSIQRFSLTSLKQLKVGRIYRLMIGVLLLRRTFKPIESV